MKIANKYEISLAELVTWNQSQQSPYPPWTRLEGFGFRLQAVAASSTPTAAPQQDQKNAIRLYVLKVVIR